MARCGSTNNSGLEVNNQGNSHNGETDFFIKSCCWSIWEILEEIEHLPELVLTFTAIYGQITPYLEDLIQPLLESEVFRREPVNGSLHLLKGLDPFKQKHLCCYSFYIIISCLKHFMFYSLWYFKLFLLYLIYFIIFYCTYFIVKHL